MLFLKMVCLTVALYSVELHRKILMKKVFSTGAWQKVAIDSLKFHAGPP
jgi:hypothetical protein